MLFTRSLSEGPCVFDDIVNFALMERSSQYLVGHSVTGDGAPLCLCAGYSGEVSGFLLATTDDMVYPTK